MISFGGKIYIKFNEDLFEKLRKGRPQIEYIYFIWRCLYGTADGKKGSIIFRSFEYYSEIVKTVLDILKYMFLRGILLPSMDNRKISKFNREE